MWATNAQATALAMVASKSFANLRQRPSHAKVRSTTHLRGRTSKPCAVSERLMISIVHSPIRFKAFRNLSPRAHSKARTPVDKIAKLTKRTVGSLRQKALKLGIGLGHQR